MGWRVNWDWYLHYKYLLLAVGALLIVAIGVWINRHGSADSNLARRARQRRILIVIFGTLTLGALLIVQFAGDDRWIWMLAAIPSGLVIYQAIFLAIFKNKQFFEDRQDPPPPPEKMEDFLRPIYTAAWYEERRFYGSASLALRLALPALLIQAVLVTMGHCLTHEKFVHRLQLDTLQSGAVLAGVRLGLLGAYIYVVMFLGTRTFRADVTSGAAVWSLVTLAVAPLFAGVLVLVDKATGPNDRWSAQIIPFAAGFSLRYVANVVETGIRRFMGGPAEDTSRSVPLTQLRGVSKDVEQRLAEEGIENVAELAMANPNRLLRNTCYDKRQIATWIDQAILMTYLPLAWQTLEQEGITGAIDLVWYVAMHKRGQGLAPAASPAGPPPAALIAQREVQVPELAALGGSPAITATSALKGFEPAPPEVEALAKRNKLDADSLWQAMLRLYEDQQVHVNWALYALDESETRQEKVPPQAPPPAP